MTKYLIIFSVLLTISCRNNSNHYLINCCENDQYNLDHNGILYLAESANYESLQKLQDTLGLKKYLSEDEFKSAFDTTIKILGYDTTINYITEIIPWDTFCVKDNYIAELVLYKDNTNGREYFFQIRTFDKSRKIISIQDFAVWSEKERKFCSGDFVINEQTFTVNCGNQCSHYYFDTKGKIILAK